jgi:hypothetical protein
MIPCGHQPPQPGSCHLCQLYVSDPAYRRLWDGLSNRCRHLGALLTTELCQTCSGRVELKVFACHHPLHQRTTLAQCTHCPDFEA